jgi:hypothetical protein
MTPTRAAALAVALFSGCALLRPPPRVASDGHTATVGGETVTSDEGIELFERGGEIHVVSVRSERSFDVVLTAGEDGRPAVPEGSPIELSGGRIRLRAPGGPQKLPNLIASGQLHPHDDHFHLTHLYANADWQALYADREPASNLPPVRQQIAAHVLATLLDQRIPGTDEESTMAALRRVDSVVAKVRRGMVAGLPGRQIQSILIHDYEILADGDFLVIEGKRYQAGVGMRFVYDGDHFHVESVNGTWVQVVRLDGQESGNFEFPPSIFYEVKGNLVEGRAPSTRWQNLAESKQIRFVRDHWHLTETYGPLRRAGLMEATEDSSLTDALRESARARALDILRLRLDVGSDDEFEARLSAADRMIERHAREFDKERKAAKK